jgi:hypothetical protein
MLGKMHIGWEMGGCRSRIKVVAQPGKGGGLGSVTHNLTAR